MFFSINQKNFNILGRVNKKNLYQKTGGFEGDDDLSVSFRTHGMELNYMNNSKWASPVKLAKVFLIKC